MQSMEFIPLFGTSFSVYAPIITGIVGVCTIFNIYTRILKLVGVEDEDSAAAGACCSTKMSEEQREELEAGKKLVAGAMRSLNNRLFIESTTGGPKPPDTAGLLSSGLSNDDSSSGAPSPDPVDSDEVDDEGVMMGRVERGEVEEKAPEAVRNALFSTSSSRAAAAKEEKKKGGGWDTDAWGSSSSAPTKRPTSVAESWGSSSSVSTSAAFSAVPVPKTTTPASDGWGSSSGGDGWGSTSTKDSGRYGGRYG